MFTSTTKVYSHGSTVHIVDPSREHLPLIRKMNPGFKVPESIVPRNFVPNARKAKTTFTGIDKDAVYDMDTSTLWKTYFGVLSGEIRPSKNKGSASVLDLCIELTRRIYAACTLCGHECGINRYQKPGVCGLSVRAFVAALFEHMSEERVITPAGTLKQYGCALNCDGCQSWELIHRKQSFMEKHGIPLDEDIWQHCTDFKDAATLTLVGGNPTENLLPFLLALRAMPKALESKPIVWNDHGYTTKQAYDLLRCFVDVYVPDFKGTTECVKQYAHVDHYWETVTAGIGEMVTHPARVIVRHLLVPDHFECCTRPVIEWLAQYKERLWLSLLTYMPDSRALKDPALNRPTSGEELQAAQELMNSLELRDVEAEPEAFWKQRV